MLSILTNSLCPQLQHREISLEAMLYQRNTIFFEDWKTCRQNESWWTTGRIMATKKGSVEDEGEKTERWKFTIKPGHLTTDSILPYGGRRNYYYYYFVLFCFDFKFFSFVERDYKTIATFLIQSNLSEKSEDLLFITSIVIAQFRETYPYLQPCKSESVFFLSKSLVINICYLSVKVGPCGEKLSPRS